MDVLFYARARKMKAFSLLDEKCEKKVRAQRGRYATYIEIVL
jgi:hypothetical protein